MRILAGLICAIMLQAIDILPKGVEIDEVNANVLSFRADHLKVGQSGIVLTQNQGYNIIIASAVIKSIKNGTAYASYTPFDSISQKYLPTPQSSPAQGDKIIFGSFYNKSIAIAPDQESYNKILSLASNTSFAHIDLLAAFLAKDGINDPKPKHLNEFCNVYSIGLLYILASNGVNVLDCQSFSILEVLPFDKPYIQNTQAPFFSRIVNIDTGSLANKLRSKKSRQYFPYYDNLLRSSLKSFENLKHKE